VSGGTTAVSSYGWDHADNRLSRKGYSNGTLAEDFRYGNNGLNQVVAITNMFNGTIKEFLYDANGNSFTMPTES